MSATAYTLVRRRTLPRWVVLLLPIALIVAGGWLWLRDSSLVAVKRVTIVGVSGPDASQVRSALQTAARNMTTLDVRTDQLKTAVAPYPVVKDLQVSTQFPHGLRIQVIEQIPVAVVAAGARQLPVAGDGTLLHDAIPSGTLPTIPLTVPPGGRRLTDPNALGAVALLAAAPYQLLGRIGQVTTAAGHGLVAQVRSGPSVYFGSATALAAKWTAAVAVLGDAGSAGASYIDVSDPQRPVAGASSTGVGSAAAGTPVTH